MKKNVKHISIVSILVLSLGVFITGCSSDTRKPTNENAPNGQEGMDARQDNDLTGDRNIIKDTVEPRGDGLGNEDLDALDDNELNRMENNDSMINRSKSISDKLSNLEGVSNANVVITGNTALVGVDLPKDAQDSKVTELKNMIKTKVKEIDKDVDNVVVTSDADLTTRIKNVGTDIQNGKPLSGLTAEIEEVIRRITPNM